MQALSSVVTIHVRSGGQIIQNVLNLILEKHAQRASALSIVERDVRSCYWLLRGDPCRLARQVKKIGWLNMADNPMLDPCRLVRQVKKIGRLNTADNPMLDPCRLVRQGTENGRLTVRQPPL